MFRPTSHDKPTITREITSEENTVRQTLSRQEKQMSFNRITSMTSTGLLALVATFSVLFLAGCTGGTKENAPPVASHAGDHNQKEVSAIADQNTDDADIKAERAKLSSEDQTLVAAQELCAISDERLGVMGPPVKLVIKGQPVFLCCGNCKKKALADPEKTLAKVEELKAKVKAGASK
jgi:hypothetical protein